MSRLHELIQAIHSNHVYIQMHNYPDQDAVASAKGLQVLLSTKGIQSTICYQGQIDKFNTIKMLELLHINIYTLDDLPTTDEDEIILVDGQKGNINVEDCVGKEIACIDHHYAVDLSCYRFADIRSDIGACSTIIATYFIENQIPIDKEIATALVYGIKLDTDNLTRGTSETDIDIFCYLYKIADWTILRKLDSCSLKASDLGSYQQAISDLRINRHIGLANIGKDCSEAIIATLSDFLLTLVEVDFTLIHSYRAGGIKFSVRSEDANLDASVIIKTALSGLGDGGGHSSMAAGFIPNVSNEADANRIAFHIEEKVISLIESMK